MGNAPSKSLLGGMLQGNSAPPLPGVVLPPKLNPKVMTYPVTVPQGMHAGGKLEVIFEGGETSFVTIPRCIKKKNGYLRAIKSGDQFPVEYGDRDLVIVSTLPELPGLITAQAKNVIFASASYSCNGTHGKDHESSLPLLRKTSLFTLKL